MPGKTKRFELRISEDDLEQLRDKAALAGITVSELVLSAALAAQTWTAKDKKLEAEKNRQLAKIGNNLNQVARWCNTYKSGADAFNVCRLLLSVDRELKKAIS